jgi:AraC-like DNA-binding protein
MHTVGICIAGFSIVSAALLFVVYAYLLTLPTKTAYSILSCFALIAALATLQYGHLAYFLGGREPFNTAYYHFALYVAPPAFYCFARWAVLPSESVRTTMLLHLLPITLAFVGRTEITLPILFMCGAGYSLWLGNVVYGLRMQRKQFRFEFLYFAVLSIIAVAVLILGFSIPYIDHDYFYYFYCISIGVGIGIMMAALIVNPELLAELNEAAQVRYGSSTLKDIDVDEQLKKLDSLMASSKIYQNENLSLSSLAAEMGLSSHQLSELVNSRLGVGFSRYIRERRVAAAKQLLVSAPQQSILSISMDTGFKSQSSFYAAFKEITSQSPGDYRKERLKSPE